MRPMSLSAMLFLAVAGAAGQSYNFDNSGNATLTGQYFVREVVLLNLSAQGGIGQALSVIGIATFDGAGNYNFSGQLSNSTSTTASSASYSGTYAVAANGFLRIASFALAGAFPSNTATFAYGGVGAVGPSAFTASATESSSPVFDVIVGIPVGSSVSNASLQGAYNAVYLNFPQAAIGQTRQAYMPLVADGAGGFGAVTATGSATDNASLTTQAIPSVTYSLTGAAGAINFGAAAANQLIGGMQAFFVSPDGALLVGGSASGYDLLLASPATSSASDTTFQGLYYLGGLEADNSVWASQAESLPDAFYGSMNANGQGNYTSHLRLNSNGYSVEDLTSGWQPSVQSNGSFTPGDGDQYWLGGNGKVVLALGQGNFYSIIAGLLAVNYTTLYPKTDVFLNPLGIVNAASFAPPTNPVAPQEMVTVFGSNMSNGTAQASTFPLPTNLSNTRVLVNGVAAPLLAVSPTQVTMLVPSIATPDFTAYAAFEVQNLGATCPSAAASPGSQCPTSKLVTMYTNYTAPGVFSLAQDGFGPAAAENVQFQVISANNPAEPGGISLLFLTGMGTVTPALADGVPSSPTGVPNNVLDIYNESGLYVYVDGVVSPKIQFAGVVPGYAAGLYQIDAQIPSGVSNGDDYLDILTPNAEAEQVTLNIAGASGAAAAVRGRAIDKVLGRGRRSGRRAAAIPRGTTPVPR
ncbi:MAG: hypothetical protein ABSB86_10790 [Bryobacteraceae bacterium]